MTSRFVWGPDEIVWGPVNKRDVTDEARDEAGRWTSGGGGAPTPESLGIKEGSPESLALNHWTQAWGDINAAAKGRITPEPGGRTARDLKALDSVMAQSKLTAPIEVARGIEWMPRWNGSMPYREVDPSDGKTYVGRGGYQGNSIFAGMPTHDENGTPLTEGKLWDQADKIVGQRMTLPGFTATTPGQEPPSEFNNRGYRVALRLSVPAGVSAIDLSQIGFHPDEHETLLNRGITIEVTGAKRESHYDVQTNSNYERWVINAKVDKP